MSPGWSSGCGKRWPSAGSRRDGQDVMLGGLQRIRRAYLARSLMTRGIRRLSRLGPRGSAEA
jgi:hypothetical protein